MRPRRRTAPPCSPAICSGCHSGDDARAPSPEVLRGRSPQAILDALTAGSMKYQGLALSGEERRAIAEYLTGRKLRAPLSPAARSATAPLDVGAARQAIRAPARSGTAGDRSIDNTHFQPADQAGLTAEQVPRLHLKWAFGFPDATSAWAQPTIVGGRLYVGSQNGTVYSLDAASGCVVWTFVAQGGVRASISIGPRLRSRNLERASARQARVRPRRGGRLRRVLLGSERVRLRGRRGDGPVAVDAEGRRSSAGAADRVAHAVRRSPVRADLVVRRRRQAARLRLLHLPRRDRRARCQDRRGHLEELHHRRGAAPAARLRGRHRTARTVGRRHLVGADDRRQARRALRRRRQHLQRRGAADDRRGARARFEDAGSCDGRGRWRRPRPTSSAARRAT